MAERKSLPDPAVLVNDDTNHPTLFPFPLWMSPLVVGQTSCMGPPKLLQTKSKGLAQLKWFSREFKENTLLNWSSLNSVKMEWSRQAGDYSFALGRPGGNVHPQSPFTEGSLWWSESVCLFSAKSNLTLMRTMGNMHLHGLGFLHGLDFPFQTCFHQ